MEHLLTAWPRVLQRMRGARRVMLLTDYDGTLTPIVERPELAVLSPGVRRLLADLSRCANTRVGIVSGRALSDLKKRVGASSLIYAGNHGLEIEGPGLRFVNPVAAELQPVLRVIHHVLCRALGTIGGVLVENKGLTLSVHYRQVEEPSDANIEHIVKQVVGPAEASGKARMTSGKKVYEIRPAVNWDKGKAVRLLMKRYAKGGRMSGLVPMYLGDDATDEDAFRVIEAYGNGISVYVGEPTSTSAAAYFVRSPDEVAAFLEAFLNASRQAFAHGQPLPSEKPCGDGQVPCGGYTCEAESD